MTNRAIGSQPIGSDEADGRCPWIDRIDPSVDDFLPLFYLSAEWRRRGKAVEVERSFEDGRERCINHDCRVEVEAVQNVCHPCTSVANSWRRRGRKRGREAKNNPLVRACIESTYVCTRPRRGQASFAERPRVPPPPTFPSWFAIVMQICQGDSRFLRHDLECLHPLN